MPKRKNIQLTIVLICFFALLNKNANAQNLIPNGSFEQHYNCNYSNNQWFLPIDSVLVDWVDPAQISSDYFNPCNIDSTFRVPLNGFGFQSAKEGVSYVGILAFDRWTNLPQPSDYREFIQCKLKEKLVVGKKYSFTMFTNLQDSIQNSGLGDPLLLACNNLGAYLTTWQYLKGSNSITLPNTHQINFNQIVTDTTNWVKLKQNFIADSAYEYITIGNLNSDTITDIDTVGIPLLVGSSPNGIAYYFIDDVSLVEDTTSGFVNENGSKSKLIIYPNPVSNQLTVSSNQFKVNAIEIMDLLGRVVFNQPINKSTNQQIQVDVSSLSNGIYFIKATDVNGNVSVGKFVKE